VAFYHSFVYEVMLVDQDVAMLEDVLMGTDTQNGLTVIVSSPGGSALAVERLINVCREHSAGDFEVIVPKQAKSAATLLCFGANRILMSRTSELGPIDMQVYLRTQDGGFYAPVDVILNSYETLLDQATKTEGRPDPYLQQLMNYDARLIEYYKREQALGEDIAVAALQQSMFSGKSRRQILRRIRPFIEPSETKSHGRAILIEQAKQCGLNVQEVPIHEELWEQIMELHVRADQYVSRDASKLIESAEHQFYVPAPSAEV